MRELTKFISRYALQDGRNKKVLEIGIGDTTTFKDYFKEMRYDYVAVDTDERYVNQWCRLGDMNKLPFQDKEFDICFSCHSFEHTETPCHALREMKRVTKKFIIIFTPNHCFHQVLGADLDHISVATEFQVERWFKYVGITKILIYTQKEGIEREQDYNLCSFGEV